MEEGARILATRIGQFLFDASVLLQIVFGLVLILAPFIGMGLAAYYVFRSRVSRWTLRALVVGIPLAVAVGYALIIGVMVIYVGYLSGSST